MSSSELEMYRQLVEHAPTMLWRADAAGRCTFVNAGWRAFTGLTLDEALAGGWDAAVHPDDVERRRVVCRDHSERCAPFELEYRLRRGDGSYRWILEKGAPVFGIGGTFDGFVGSALDIDERRAAEVPGASEFFEMSLDNLTVAGADGYFKRLNSSWTRSLGRSAEELMSVPLIEWVHPDDHAEVRASRARILAGAPLRGVVSRYRHKDGSYRTFEWNVLAHVERGLIYGVARDVTEQREAQRVLAELTESLTTILDSIAEGVIAIDADERISRMNPVAERLTGWTLADAYGAPLERVLRLVDAQTREPLDRSRGQSTEDALLIDRDGSEKPLACSCAPLRGDDGRVRGAVLVLRDTSAQKESERARKELQRQLILADRLASVGTLAAGVAHEINNPLTSTMGNLELLGAELRRFEAGTVPANPVDWAEMALDAREGAERIRRIVGGLRSFSRAEEERRAVIDVKPVVELACNMTFNEIRHRARLVKDYGPLPKVEADDGRLGQVFINLLVNAAQAIPEGQSDSHEIRVATFTDSQGRAVVEVSDTGPGIPENVITRVFDPFFTTKPVGVGTGLGLSICHTIVSGMGGEISVRNRAEGGATIRVVLAPAASHRSESSSSATAAEPAGSRRRATVLVVDDEPSVGLIIGRMLRGHDVTVVTTAREALELVLSRPPYDVILSDLMMPEMSGMDLHAALMRERPEAAARMVFVTGGAFTASAQTFLDNVSNERLFKPFDHDRLIRLVEFFAGLKASAA